MNKYKKLSNVLTRNAYYAFLLVAVIGSALFLSSHYVETSIFENHNSVRKLEQAINTLRYTVVNTQRLSFQGAIFHDENTILMAAAESSKFYDNIEALRIEIEQYHVKLDETLQSDELHDHIIVDALQILDTIKGKYQQYLLLNISTSVKILEELPVSPDALVTLRSSQDQFQNDINKLQEKIGEIVLFNTSFIDSILHLPSYLFVLTFLIVIGLLYNFRLVTNKLLTAPVNMVLEHIHEINKTKKYTNVELPVTSVGEVAKLCEEINLVFKEIDDITVSKEALEVAKEEAVAAGNAKSDFLSHMSHELRTPLNAIIALSQMSLEESIKDTKLEQNVKDILLAGNHLHNLVNDILDFSVLEKGRLNVSMTAMDIDSCIQSSLSLLQPDLQRKNIKLNYVPPDKPVGVSADSLRVSQILINLVSNAAKYGGDNVDVKVVDTDPDKVLVEIQDDGPGIRNEDLEKIFQPFVKLNPSSERIDGAGIGLALSKKLIEIMGGTIGVSSRLGKGSCFWIRLQRSNLPDKSTVNTDHASFQVDDFPRGNRVFNVLYVEDNPVNMKIVKELLRRIPHINFLAASTPSEAIEIVDACDLDLMLLDITLPEMNGFELLKVLRQKERLVNVPAIAVSANSLQSDLEKSKQAGFYMHITKPIDIYEFRETILSMTK